MTLFSIGTDRDELLAAGPDFAGYKYIIRLAGFCRTERVFKRVGVGGPVFLCQIAVSHHGVSALSTGDPPC